MIRRICAMVLVLPVLAAADATADAAVAAAVRTGTTALLAMQAADGSFGEIAPTALAGMALLAAGVPIQAVEARAGRPGYPWKLGLALAGFGACMLWDLRFRDAPGLPVQLHQTAILMAAPGAWILLWWPVARRRGDG